jgi:hypothetical protein
MRLWSRQRLVICVAALLGPTVRGATHQYLQHHSPASHWKSTDIWTLKVENFAAPQEMTPESSAITVKVISSPEAMGYPIWSVLRFQASSGSAMPIPEPYFIWVEKGTGWLGKVCQFEPAVKMQVDKNLIRVGDVSLLRVPVPGIPLEMVFPNQRDSTLCDSASRAKVEVRREDKGELIVMELTLSIPEQEDVRVVQISATGTGMQCNPHLVEVEMRLAFPGVNLQSASSSFRGYLGRRPFHTCWARFQPFSG